MIDSLAGGDILKFDSVLKLSYKVVMGKLWADHEKEEFRKRLIKQMEKAAKNK